jgi:hypothetical protein
VQIAWWYLPLQTGKQSAADPQQVLVIQILDCFGTLFMDFKGTSPACFMFGATKLCATTARGILLGVFIGGLPAAACVLLRYLVPWLVCSSQYCFVLA